MEKNPHTSEQKISTSQKAEENEGDDKTEDNLTLAEIFSCPNVSSEEDDKEIPKAELRFNMGELLSRIEEQKKPRKYKPRKRKNTPKKSYPPDQPTKRKKTPPPSVFHPVWEKRLEKLICGHDACASMPLENYTAENADRKMKKLEKDLYVTAYKNEDNEFCLLFLIKAPCRSDEGSVLTMNAVQTVERITCNEKMEMESNLKECPDHIELLCVIHGTKES